MKEDLRPHLTMYAAGLEAELSLLRQLQQLSAAQQVASKDHDLEQLTRIADERGRLMAGLVKVEHEISGARHLLAERRKDALDLPGFDDVAALHRVAGRLVTDILAADKETMAALREAEDARRAAAQALDAGEATLAAYRRVVTPGATGPALLNRHG